MHQYALEPNSGIHKEISISEAIRFDSHPDGQVEGSPFSYITCTLYGSNQVSISILLIQAIFVLPIQVIIGSKGLRCEENQILERRLCRCMILSAAGSSLKMVVRRI